MGHGRDRGGHPWTTLWTIGHSTRGWEEFEALLRENGIQAWSTCAVSPVRATTRFSPEAMAPALAAAGIRYWPLPALGGRRDPLPDSPNRAWRVDAFRGYADYMATADYIPCPRR